MGYRNVDIGDDTLDSRDIQKMYDELVSEQDDLEEAIKDARADLKLVQVNGGPAEGDDELDAALTALDEAERGLEQFHVEHSGIMREIEDAMEQVGEWKYGETLIHERHWEEFVEELMNELGYVNTKDAWFIEIDWKRTAENVAMDYTTVDLNGHTYYARG